MLFFLPEKGICQCCLFFECYNHGELEYGDEDFPIGFVVRLYLLFEI